MTKLHSKQEEKIWKKSWRSSKFHVFQFNARWIQTEL